MRGIWKKGMVTALTAALLAGNIGGVVPMGQERVSVKAAEVTYVPVNQEFEKTKTAYFELTEGGVVTFENGGSQKWVALYQVSDDGNETEYARQTLRLRLAPGKYKVVGHYNYNDYDKSYINKINFISEPGVTYEKEWNDTLDTANEIQTNIAYTGNLNQTSGGDPWYYSEDKDYYKFELKQGGLVQIQYSIDDLSCGYNRNDNTGNKNEIILYCEDKEGNVSEIANICTSHDKTRYSKRYRLPKGIYYVLINNNKYSSVRENISDYQLKVNYEPETSTDHEQEYNNTKDTANEISTNTGYTGNITTYGDEYSSNILSTPYPNSSFDKDYYKFTLPTTSRVKLKMQVPRQSEDGLFHTVLYKADATSKITDMKTTTNPVAYSAEQLLEAGTYYVLVERGSTINDTVDYTLTVNAKEVVVVQGITLTPGKTPAYVGDSF